MEAELRFPRIYGYGEIIIKAPRIRGRGNVNDDDAALLILLDGME